MLSHRDLLRPSTGVPQYLAISVGFATHAKPLGVAQSTLEVDELTSPSSRELKHSRWKAHRCIPYDACDARVKLRMPSPRHRGFATTRTVFFTPVVGNLNRSKGTNGTPTRFPTNILSTPEDSTERTHGTPLLFIASIAQPTQGECRYN